MSLRRLLTIPGLPLLLTALVTVAVLLHGGVAPDEVAAYAVYIGLGVALPGVFGWRLLTGRMHVDATRRRTWLEDLSLGTIFGFGIQLPLFLLGVAIGVPQLVLALPALVLLASATPAGRRAWQLPTARVHAGTSWGLASVAMYGLVSLRHSVGGDSQAAMQPDLVGVDVSFHQALVADIAARFPPQLPFLLDTPLDYHWFVHAQIAAARTLTGIDSLVQLRLLLPVLTVLLIVSALGAVALRLSEWPPAAVLAPGLLVVGVFQLLGPDYPEGNFIEPFLTWRYVTSPSQTYGVMMSMPALAMSLEALRPGPRMTRGAWAALAIALLALSGSKATFLPIFLCGAIAAWIISVLVHRRVDRASTGVVVLVALATLFAQFVMFGGSTGGLTFAPMQTVEAVLESASLSPGVATYPTMTGTLLTAWLLYGAGAVGLVSARHWTDGRAVFLLVCIAAGIVTALVYTRVGQSQLWFQRSVAELVVLLSAWGLSFLLPRPIPAGRVIGLVGIAAAAGISAYVGSVVVGAQSPGTGVTTLGLALTTLTPLAVVAGYLVVRRRSRGTGADVARQGRLVVVTVLLGLGTGNIVQLGVELLTGDASPAGEPRKLFATGGVAASVYIRDHSATDDIVATNMHCRAPHQRPCDNRHFWVSAYTERRVVIEGWGYSAPTNENAPEGVSAAELPVPYPERLAVNDAAFVQPSEVTVGRLVDTYSVDWLLVGKDYAADVAGLRALHPLLQRVYSNDAYVVFEVR